MYGISTLSISLAVRHRSPSTCQRKGKRLSAGIYITNSSRGFPENVHRPCPQEWLEKRNTCSGHVPAGVPPPCAALASEPSATSRLCGAVVPYLEADDAAKPVHLRLRNLVVWVRLQTCCKVAQFN